jgi:hypothetical protein
MTTTQCPQCLAILPPRAKLCLRCGNPTPPAPAAEAPARVPADESAPAAAPTLPARAISVAAALGAIALFIVLVYASC